MQKDTGNRPDLIDAYLLQVESALASYAWIKSVRILRCDIVRTEKERILVYRFRVTLNDNSLLEIMERVVAGVMDDETVTTTDYRFHWQNNSGDLITRWDNAPHFPELNGFPHHVHIGGADKAAAGVPVTALDILAEIDRKLD
jgi:hypothetical protein